MNDLLPMVMRAGVLAVSLVSLSGCASTINDLPFVYRIDIQQGNVVDQAMIDQLELGMEKRKVQFALGTPLLTDTFHDDRWEYLFSYRRGTKRREQRRVTLFFEEDRLARIEGDVKPSVVKRQPSPRPDTMVTVPPAKPRGLLAAILPEFLGGKPALKLPQEVGEDAQPELETVGDSPPGATPSEPSAEPTATAAAPDSTEEMGAETGATPVESTESYRKPFTRYGEAGGQQVPDSGEPNEGATEGAPEPPAATGTTARVTSTERPGAQAGAGDDFVVGEESESVSGPVPDDEQRSFFKQLVDRFRQTEPVDDSDERSAPSGNETTVPVP